jgi:hypothetical protein
MYHAGITYEYEYSLLKNVYVINCQVSRRCFTLKCALCNPVREEVEVCLSHPHEEQKNKISLALPIANFTLLYR